MRRAGIRHPQHAKSPQRLGAHDSSRPPALMALQGQPTARALNHPPRMHAACTRSDHSHQGPEARGICYGCRQSQQGRCGADAGTGPGVASSSSQGKQVHFGGGCRLRECRQSQQGRCAAWTADCPHPRPYRHNRLQMALALNSGYKKQKPWP